MARSEHATYKNKGKRNKYKLLYKRLFHFAEDIDG